MRPRDLTKKNWHQHPHALGLKSGLEATIHWATGTIDLMISNPTCQASIVIPRQIFDKMVDWYTKTCDEAFWNTPKSIAEKDGDMTGLELGDRIPDTRKEWAGIKRHEWQIFVSRLIWVENKNKGVCDTPRVDRSITLRSEGLKDLVVVFSIRRGDFDRIVNWYNSDYKNERKAA